MLVTLIYPIKFVPLRHDKEHRRDTSLSASSIGERLAYIPHLDRRDGGKHPCGTGICKARCYGSRPALPDTGLLSSPPMDDSNADAAWVGGNGHGGNGGGGAGAGIGTRGGTGGADEAMAFIQAMVGVSRENFEATLDLIDQRYGSLSAYIENQLGFSKEEQQQLRAKYLTN